MQLRDRVVEEATLLADAIKRAPHARVRKYPTWDLAQLGRHVAEIHGWVTGILRDGATERPERAKLTDVPDDEVAGVVHIAAVALGAALDEVEPSTPVWGFTGDGTAAFWRRRMLLETTIHRWDAQDAVGAVSPIPHEVALDGLDECLAVYATPALPDWSLSCDGPRLAATCPDGSCEVSGGAVDLWLFAMGRRGLRGLDVTGDPEVATRLAAELAEVRGPAG